MCVCVLLGSACCHGTESVCVFVCYWVVLVAMELSLCVCVCVLLGSACCHGTESVCVFVCYCVVLVAMELSLCVCLCVTGQCLLPWN